MILNKIEVERLNAFRLKHLEKECYLKAGKSGKYKITISATGICDIIVIKCCNCKEKEDVTDYDSV